MSILVGKIVVLNSPDELEQHANNPIIERTSSAVHSSSRRTAIEIQLIDPDITRSKSHVWSILMCCRMCCAETFLYL